MVGTSFSIHAPPGVTINILSMTLSLTRPGRIGLLALIALAMAVAAVALPPFSQSQEYHRFADHRAWLGIPNFLDVVSNVGFLLVGLAGLGFLWNPSTTGASRSFVESAERLPYAVFFAAILLVCFGSAYYHWKPGDSTLAWDRLPMTAAFMSILAAVVAERVNLRAGLWLLGPLVLAGAASVVYWRCSGNLWPYAAAQYGSILLVCVALALFPPRYNRSADLLWAAGLYSLAKVAEALDAQILAASRIVSGHTLKHLIAALAVYWVLRMLVKRSIASR